MKKKLLTIACVIGAGLLLAFSVQTYVEKKIADENSLLPMLYQQRAAEYRALCFQAYNAAHDYAKAVWDTSKHHDHLAIVTDLDETALNNTPGEAYAYQHDIPFDLPNWWLHGKPDAVPGAVEFFQWAKKLGYHIYYISNRSDAPDVIDATRIRMDTLGFPETKTAPDDKYFLFSHNKQSTKQPRRDYIKSHFHDRIVLLLGDNLADIHTAFDKIGDTTFLDDTLRWKLTGRFKKDWGSKYIVFPNAYYGDWEGSLYNGYKKTHPIATLTLLKKYELREDTLKTFDFTQAK